MILINDLSAHIRTHESAIEEAISRVVRSGWVVLGPEVKRFESSFAEYLGADRCVGVANGTDAIELALRALDVMRGDRVATVANAGAYTTTALLAIGAEPVFLDVDLWNRNVMFDEVERAIEQGVKAVVVTHLYGLAAPALQRIAELCKRRSISLLEDCAQAHGARIDGRCVGTFGNAATFSFYPTKNLGALGDGGAVVTSNEKIAERVSSLRQYGWSSKYQVAASGGRNSRLDEMQAAIISAFLPGLDAANERRREIAARYSAGICHKHVEVPAAMGVESVAHLYVVRSPRRDGLREHLRTLDIASDVHYPIPDHRQPVFGQRYAQLSLPNTERLAREILTLPCYPEMTEAQVDSVIEAINAWPE